MALENINPGQYTGTQGHALRIITIISCLFSIVAIATVLWWWIAHGQHGYHYRHLLIWALLAFDFGKAVVMIVYPIKYLQSDIALDKVQHSVFCDVIGFLTAMFIEGNDIATLSLAVNTALVVFCPRFLSRHKKQMRVLLAGLFVVFPIVLAGAALIRKGYTHFTAWCYIRVFPLWYRIALSWAPRIAIVLAIAIIYIVIYWHVRSQIQNLERSLSVIIQSGGGSLWPTRPKGRFRAWLAQFPGLAYLSPFDWRSATVAQLETTAGGTATATVNKFVIPEEDGPRKQRSFDNLQSFISSENYLQFQMRRSSIERNVGFLFIYPIVYVLIWIFPFVQEMLHYHYDLNRSSLFWISVIADWMKPFSGFVNAVVFVIKEKQHLEAGAHDTNGKRRHRLASLTKKAETRLEDANKFSAEWEQFALGRPLILTESRTELRTMIHWSEKMWSAKPKQADGGSPVDVISPLTPLKKQEENAEMDLLEFLDSM
ncbi:hypothetical protein TRVA0_043S00430 [Trichomonascus vanleenenianus]|uniref:uncharacterized protein n=1 Tax=Trichomonascus vanleenenianus TaxID=2268995 RepID=UPI003EC9B25C